MRKCVLLLLVLGCFHGRLIGEPAQEPTLFKSSKELLERHGLDELAGRIGDFLHLFDSGVHLFSCLNDEEQLTVLNNFVVSFKEAYAETVDRIGRSDKVPKGGLSMAEMRDFLQVYKSVLHQHLRADPRIRGSEWFRFTIYIDLAFEAMEKLYATMVASDMYLNWFTISMGSRAVDLFIPNELFDRASFGSLFHYPGDFRDKIHAWLESTLTSSFGPSFKTLVHLVNKNIQEHLEV